MLLPKFFIQKNCFECNVCTYLLEEYNTAPKWLQMNICLWNEFLNSHDRIALFKGNKSTVLPILFFSRTLGKIEKNSLDINQYFDNCCSFRNHDMSMQATAIPAQAAWHIPYVKAISVTRNNTTYHPVLDEVSHHLNNKIHGVLIYNLSIVKLSFFLFSFKQGRFIWREWAWKSQWK